MPIETLEKVVNQKRLWIHSKLIEKESLNPPTPAKEYVSGEGFYYLGRSYSLKLVDGVEGKLPLRFYQSRFELQPEALAQGREAFIRWYCDRLSSILDTQIAAVVDRLEASPRSVQVRDLGDRWGSCGHKEDLALLNRGMICAVKGCFGYPVCLGKRAIEIIGWIGNRNIPKLKIMNY